MSISVEIGKHKNNDKNSIAHNGNLPYPSTMKNKTKIKRIAKVAHKIAHRHSEFVPSHLRGGIGDALILEAVRVGLAVHDGGVDAAGVLGALQQHGDGRLGAYVAGACRPGHGGAAVT